MLSVEAMAVAENERRLVDVFLQVDPFDPHCRSNGVDRGADHHSQIDRLPTPALQRLFRGGARLAKLFGITGAPVSDPAETGSN